MVAGQVIKTIIMKLPLWDYMRYWYNDVSTFPECKNLSITTEQYWISVCVFLWLFAIIGTILVLGIVSLKKNL